MGEVAGNGRDPSLGRLRHHGPTALALVLTAAVALGVDPISRDASHVGRLLLAAVAMALVHAGFRLRELDPTLDAGWRSRGGAARRTAARWLVAAWIAAAGVGALNYYQFSPRVALEVGDYADVTYYYLNSKYFPELGYTRFYEALLVADAEGPQRFAGVAEYRDLSAYRQRLPRSAALARAPEIRARFTPRRWAAFRDDVAFFSASNVEGGWGYFFIDHGFNPPPAWTVVGGTLSSLVSPERLKWITSLDMVLVALLFVAVGRVWGLPALLVSVVFCCVTFSGRWPILGHSLLRFDWLVALVGAVACWKRDRPATAGALLAYAASSRIFPAIFVLPYLARLVRDVVRERAVGAQHRRFLGGALAVALLLNGAALLRYGPDAYREASVNLALHASPESFSSHRVGLGHVLLYRGEWTRGDMEEHGEIEGKRAQLWRLNPWLRAGGIVTMALVAAFAWRSRRPLHRLAWLGIYPLFVMTNPQINYYNLRLLLVLLHVEEWPEYRAKVGLYLLFATEVATQAMFCAGATRYAVTAIASYGIFVYLVVMAGFLLHERLRARDAPPAPSTAEAG